MHKDFSTSDNSRSPTCSAGISALATTAVIDASAAVPKNTDNRASNIFSRIAE